MRVVLLDQGLPRQDGDDRAEDVSGTGGPLYCVQCFPTLTPAIAICAGNSLCAQCLAPVKNPPPDRFTWAWYLQQCQRDATAHAARGTGTV
jgi:hypothetical protein